MTKIKHLDIDSEAMKDRLDTIEGDLICELESLVKAQIREARIVLQELKTTKFNSLQEMEDIQAKVYVLVNHINLLNKISITRSNNY